MLAELDLEIERMRARTKQDGDLAQRNTLIAQLRNPLRDEPRLLVFVAGADDYRRLSTLDPRVKPLLKALFNVGDDRVGDVEYRLSAAKVFFQLDDLRRRKQLRKLEHVAMTRAAKRVDRLKLVAYDGHVLVSGGHQLYDLRLEFVRVLILVDHDVAILVRQPVAQLLT